MSKICPWTDNLSLVSRDDSSTQLEIPVRLYECFRKLHEILGSANDVHIDGTTTHSMLCLVDELRARDILPYLVPQELESMSPSKMYVPYMFVSGSRTGEFCRIQLALKSQDDNIARTVALAGYWLQQCWSNHHECPCPSLASKVWPKMPNRVVDLTDYHAPPFSLKSRVKVIETNASRRGYAALSYRWPQKVKESSMLSCSTLSKLSQGIAASDLLCEIQDACTLAKGLGIRYVWVDALVKFARFFFKQRLTSYAVHHSRAWR
jgi:hypothetical protein